MTRDADGLTPKQRAFVDLLIRDPESNTSRAYASAYGVPRGPVSEAAGSRLLRHVKVTFVLSRLRAKGVEKAQQELAETTAETTLTLAAHLGVLDQLRRGAAADGKWTAAVRAEELRAKNAGLAIGGKFRLAKRLEDMTAEELEEAARIVGPPIAKALTA